jgi:integrase
MPHHLLKAAEVPKLIAFSRGKGKFRDGAGLYLDVRAPGQASWAYQFRLNGKTLWGSIGPASIYSLTKARDKHRDLRELVHKEIDPRKNTADVIAVDAGAAYVGAEKPASATFGDALTDYLGEASPSWKGGTEGKEAISYRRSFDRIPDFLKRAADSIQPQGIRDAVKVWADKPVTMRRMKTRIKTVLKFAADGEIRSRKPGRKVVHHPSMPFARVPRFMPELIAHGTTESRALAFTILTAARTDETLGATWSEIDEVVDNEGEAAKPTWIVPPERMKAERVHRIPLTAEALALLGPRGADDAFIFPGYLKRGNKLRDSALLQTLRLLRPDEIDPVSKRPPVVHGFRSSFRTWVGEKTTYDGALGEFALSHAVGPDIERAYQHGDALEKRRPLMADWSAFCMSAAYAILPAQQKAGAGVETSATA